MRYDEGDPRQGQVSLRGRCHPREHKDPPGGILILKKVRLGSLSPSCRPAYARTAIITGRHRWRTPPGSGLLRWKMGGVVQP